MKQLTIFLLFLVLSIYAQKTTGFMNRKLFFMSGGAFGVAFSNPIDYRVVSKPDISYGIFPRWGGSINYVIRNDKSLGLNFHYLKSAARIDNWAGHSLADIDLYYFGANYTIYWGNNLAPVGHYIRLEGGMAYLDAKLFSSNISIPKNRLETVTPYGLISLGRQNILFRRIIIDYGAQVGFAGLESAFYGHSGGGSSFDVSDVARNFKFRLFQQHICNLYINLGIIF